MPANSCKRCISFSLSPFFFSRFFISLFKFFIAIKHITIGIEEIINKKKYSLYRIIRRRVINTQEIKTPDNIVFWLFRSFIFIKKKNKKVVKSIIPHIKNHNVIEISEVLPPTNVSSKAWFMKYKIIALYIAKQANVKEEIPEIKKAFFEFICLTTLLYLCLTHLKNFSNLILKPLYHPQHFELLN